MRSVTGPASHRWTGRPRSGREVKAQVAVGPLWLGDQTNKTVLKRGSAGVCLFLLQSPILLVLGKGVINLVDTL